MRPILMKGHERPLTFLKYNRDGDLLFSCAKDHTPTVWFADNGERLGTYRGHNGAVWTCDVSRDSMRLLTGSADQTVKLWNVQTGTQLYTFNFGSPARSVEFAIGDKLAVITTDPFMDLTSAIHVKRISKDPTEPETEESVLVIKGPQGRINRAVGDLSIVLSLVLEKILLENCLGESDKESGHKKTITSLAKAADSSHFLTGSLDKSAKVVLGGGQDASAVTTTDHRAGKFEAKFYDKILQEEIGGVKGHFGPINALAFNPDGKSSDEICMEVCSVEANTMEIENFQQINSVATKNERQEGVFSDANGETEKKERGVDERVWLVSIFGIVVSMRMFTSFKHLLHYYVAVALSLVLAVRLVSSIGQHLDLEQNQSFCYIQIAIVHFHLLLSSAEAESVFGLIAPFVFSLTIPVGGFVHCRSLHVDVHMSPLLFPSLWPRILLTEEARSLIRILLRIRGLLLAMCPIGMRRTQFVSWVNRIHIALAFRQSRRMWRVPSRYHFGVRMWWWWSSKDMFDLRLVKPLLQELQAQCPWLFKASHTRIDLSGSAPLLTIRISGPSVGTQ
ncbi:Eukaryotic translation initiation factor 3 subunit I [Hibiscus syriacus]|uniref:Serine-threonine kinase receptor-associated protein n=1 Tax=Hibiscus syriacus TaxID=106335 RepID=A0A6A2ZHC2_HIBSY|nr:Eukaryotic translation initiation factor 3 subunit I [Hibiscus syriacus]